MALWYTDEGTPVSFTKRGDDYYLNAFPGHAPPKGTRDQWLAVARCLEESTTLGQNWKKVVLKFDEIELSDNGCIINPSVPYGGGDFLRLEKSDIPLIIQDMS